MVHGPVNVSLFVLSSEAPIWLPGTSLTSTTGVRPLSSPNSAHQSCGPTASSPPQLTTVAGTDAAPRSGSTWALMSSWWIGLYGHGFARRPAFPATTA